MTIKVAFLGPEGTYTHQAVIQQFGNNSEEVEIYPQPSIAACFEATDSRAVDYAIVPFENSTNGQVVFTYDLLRDWFLPTDEQSPITASGRSDNESTGRYTPKFKVVAEQFVAIHHYVLSNAKNLSDINTLYSHPQVWGQVQNFLNKDEIKDLKLVKSDTSSTSKAAENVHNDTSNTTACICSQMSADLYKLPVLYEKVEDNPNNTTRFLVLGYEKPPASLRLSPASSSSITNSEHSTMTTSRASNSITSIMFTLHHDDPGALCGALDVFKKYDINLTSINSRPSHRKQWQYLFFVEFMGDHATDPNVKESIDTLNEKCLSLVVLGSFERSWRYWT